MPEYMFEILRNRTVDDRIEVPIEVPESVPEDEREDWVLKQLIDGELNLSSKEWEVTDDGESSVEYEEVTEFDA